MRSPLVIVVCLVSALIQASGSAAPAAQAPGGADVLYVMPQWLNYFGASDDEFARQVVELRRRLGEDNRYTRVGFTTYITVPMTEWAVDPSDSAVVRRALQGTIDQVDRAIARARRHSIPVCLSFVTSIRNQSDAAKQASEREDRRNMQWYDDNQLAPGWWTLSRYARRVRVAREAYIRELGRIVANRMEKYPDTLVAASGDGEVELSYERSPFLDRGHTPDTTRLADYSPFAVAEFRDWLRHSGPYAAGRPFADQGFEQGRRYAGDASPAVDTNRDGHTLNGDFGTRFTTWNLRYFDWTLEDAIAGDPHAIPVRVYQAKGWNALPDGGAGRFDAPRAREPGNAWSDVWMLFRQHMIWRYNQDFAKWVTTSADPETGATVPADRWYSDQIPADYVFGHSPEEPDIRFITSASAWWTADVRPYGSLGVTAFSTNMGGLVNKTLRNVAPFIGERDLRWGILEWHPSVPPHPSVDVFREDTDIVERLRASLVVPIFWGNPDTPIQDTGFEVALRELVERRKNGPPKFEPVLALSRTRLSFGMTRDGSVVTPSQTLQISPFARGQVGWSVSADADFIEVSPTSGRGPASLTVAIRPGTYAPGEHRATLSVTGPMFANAPQPVPVVLRVLAGESGDAPFGSIDTPPDGASGLSGVVPVGGWALDDVGVAKVEVWRDALPDERAGREGLVYLGSAGFKEGARPDVEAAFPSHPRAFRAGWALLVPTQSLPNRGNGRFRLHVILIDQEGHRTTLGTRSIICANP